MTTIVLVTTDSQVFLAADNKESSDNLRRPDVSKIVRINDWFLSGSGDVGYINILLSYMKQVEVKVFEKHEFDDRMRNLLAEKESLPASSPETREASLFGIGTDDFGDAICLIELDIDKDGIHGNVLDLRPAAPISAYALGSGADLALGAFYGVLQSVKKTAKISKELEKVFTIVGELDLYTSSTHDLIVLNKSKDV